MSKLPAISGIELIKILVKYFGFRAMRMRSSHVTLSNGLISVTVPLHRDLAKGTLNGILKDAGIDREEFLRYV